MAVTNIHFASAIAHAKCNYATIDHIKATFAVYYIILTTVIL